MKRGLVLLLLLVLAPSAAATPAGKTWTVKNYGDAPAGASSSNPGPEGSLRHLLMREANPGDTIVFDRPAELQLTAPLEVAGRLDGLTILGAVGGGHVQLHDRSAVPHWSTSTGAGFGLIVHADGVTIDGLTFTDVPLVIAGSSGLHVVRGGAVRNNVFAGRHGYLDLVAADGITIAANRFDGSQDVALDVTDSDGARIIGNQVATSRRAAFRVFQSERLLLQSNTLANVSLQVELANGSVERNTLTGRSAAVLNDWGARRGGLTVTRNTLTLAGGDVDVKLDTRLTFSRNTVTGAAEVDVSCLTEGLGGGARRVDVTGNTIERGRLGVTARCHVPGSTHITGNTIRGNRTNGIQVTQGRDVVLEGNRVESNGQTGVLFSPPANGTVRGGSIRSNGRTGLFASGVLGVRSAHVVYGGNGNLGIDAMPSGSTPAASKTRYDKKTGKLTGSACKACIVEVFEAEDGDEPGEGIRLLGETRAGSGGAWSFPKRGELDCPASGKVTVTVTKPGGGTSRFSADVECSCVISADFGVESAPRTGFANYGISIVFPAGYTLGAVTLTDPKTEKRPAAGALGPLLQWEETQNKEHSVGGEHDFFVTVTYRDRQSLAEPAPFTKVWHYAVAYDPPRGSKRCGGRLTATWKPVR